MYGSPLTVKQARGHRDHDGRYIDHHSMSQVNNVPEQSWATIAGCGCGFWGWINNDAIEVWSMEQPSAGGSAA